MESHWYKRIWTCPHINQETFSPFQIMKNNLEVAAFAVGTQRNVDKVERNFLEIDF